MGIHVIANLDAGLAALLSSKITTELLRFAGHQDLILYCLSLAVVLTSAVSLRLAVVGRTSSEMAHVLFAIAFNTLLQQVAYSSTDIGVTVVSLLTIYFWSRVLDPTEQVSSTAQYLLASTLTARLQGSVLVFAWALAFAPMDHDVTELSRLVTADSLSVWLSHWMPRSLLLLSTAVLLYFCAPFVETYPALGRLYRFAVFAFSNDPALAGLPPWLIIAALFAIWQIESDRTSKRLIAVAGTNLGLVMVLDALHALTGNDLFPVLLGLIIAIRILEDNHT